jgi:hypothetical protein
MSEGVQDGMIPTRFPQADTVRRRGSWQEYVDMQTSVHARLVDG